VSVATRNVVALPKTAGESNISVRTGSPIAFQLDSRRAADEQTQICAGRMRLSCEPAGEDIEPCDKVNQRASAVIQSAVHSVWRDVRYGLRGLRKQPGFAALAALTLGLGIGGATTIFSVIQNVLARTSGMASCRLRTGPDRESS
jgi:hypothetical protein